MKLIEYFLVYARICSPTSYLTLPKPYTEQNGELVCTALSDDHKPDRPDERKRIEEVECVL